jgi:hypothetical protein
MDVTTGSVSIPSATRAEVASSPMYVGTRNYVSTTSNEAAHDSGAVIGRQTREPINNRAHVLMRRALDVVSNNTNLIVSLQADKWMRLLMMTLQKCDLSDAPRPLVFESDNEAIQFEWIWQDRRFGMSFEPDPNESGWFLVTSKHNGGIQEYGTLDNLDLPRVARTLFNI